LITALYVDDEMAVLEVTKIFLERDGQLALDTFTDGREALESIRTGTYDVIIADYQMPEFDGISLLKTLRQEGVATPFVLFTGKGREEVAIEALH